MTDRGVGGRHKKEKERGDPKRMDLFPLVQAKGQDRTGGKGPSMYNNNNKTEIVADRQPGK